MQHLRVIGFVALLVAVASGQYTREFQSPDLGTGAYGGSYGYDVDEDGTPNLWTRSTAGQIVVYNTSLAPWWSVSFPGYEYSYLATPRDIDGDGLVVPVNMDGDGAGEVVFSGAHYAADGYTGKIRVYDASSRSLEWESSVISGFTGYATVDDVDGDGKHEVIITRYDYTSGWGYVEVYGHTGAGLNGEPGFGLEMRRPAAVPSVTRDRAEVRFQVARAVPVRLELFDGSGRRVRTLLRTELPAGDYAVRWDGNDDDGRPVAAGTYLYRLDLGGDERSGRLAVVR